MFIRSRNADTPREKRPRRNRRRSAANASSDSFIDDIFDFISDLIVFWR